MFIKSQQDHDRRPSVSGWFNSLRRGAKGRRKDSAGTISTTPSVPLYGSLGRKKPSSGCQSKARSAWDLTTISRLVRYVNTPTF